MQHFEASASSRPEMAETGAKTQDINPCRMFGLQLAAES